MTRKKALLLSVITPIGPKFKPRYLEEASVVREVKHSMEWVGVFDGWEPDQWAKSFFDKVIVLPENQGSGIARNKALQVVEGKYVYCLDYDDVPFPDAVTRLVNAVETSSLLWGAGLPVEVDEHLTPIPSSTAGITWEGNVIPKDAYYRTKETTGKYPFLPAGITLVPTDVMRAAGGWDTSFSKRGQDLPLFARISYWLEGVSFPEETCRYRRHQLSTTYRAENSGFERELLAHVAQARQLPITGYSNNTAQH